MRILKIRGQDEAVIKAQIEKEYGECAVILQTEREKKQGLLGVFKKRSYAVTVAVEEKHIQSVATPPTVINEIKDEIEKMRCHVQEVIKLNSQAQNTKKTLEDVVTQSFIKEGVHAEIVEKIIKKQTQVMSVETLAREIYEQLDDILIEPDRGDCSPVYFFLGTTGVGKTTTIAKLTAEFVLNQKRKIVLMTADTYRIAAIDQLKTYADILNVPIEVIYNQEDFKNQLNKWQVDHQIIVDTAGRSHKNKEQVQEIKMLLDEVEVKKTYLVLQMSTHYEDMKKIIDTYKGIVENLELIITKTDETDQIGQLINIAAYSKCPIAYVTTGQNVPDDIEAFNKDEYVKQLLGRIIYE